MLIGLSVTFAISDGILFPKLAGASKTMTPSSVTRKADCHPLSEMTYTPPPTLLTAYPSLGSICQKLAFTEGKTGTYFCKSSVEDWADAWATRAVQSANKEKSVFMITSPCEWLPRRTWAMSASLTAFRIWDNRQKRKRLLHEWKDGRGSRHQCHGSLCPCAPAWQSVGSVAPARYPGFDGEQEN